MFRPLSLFIGLRYTRAERKNGFISFISLISMIGLTLGVAVLITVLSVMNGFDRELKTRILGMVPQATVTAAEVIPDWKQLADEIKAQDQSVAAVAPFITLQGMITANGQVAGVVVSGVEPQYEKEVSVIDNHMTSGSLDGLKAGEFGIVLGESLVQSLGVGIGEHITLVLPEATPSIAGVIPRFKRFTLVGTFKISPELDNVMGYVAMRDAGVMLRLPEGAQGIRMQMKDIFKAPSAAINASMLDSRLMPSDWTRTHGNLFSAIQMEKAMIGLLLFLIVIVAAFNIVSSLVMLVTDKKSDIAILKTFGASPKLIMQVFMVQGMIIGVIGTVLGTVLGVTLALTVNDILVFISSVFGISLFDSSVYFVDYLPSQVKLIDVLIIVSASFLLSFLMTIYPALRASRIAPAQTLRYE
ncbi:lipoprotein-releasing ABC transporter permease subunit [Moraxella nasovis]|uniref:lipoprotein-releasing ABC transporter permease subunit n=1 Tax=Moraxella nasovis TaxID=2904121 RepID=UPI001F60D619|nr:lipoprotein-releasing ABC transporter permease subunit [Moraxella nasovis]UNU72953.1 lipoprotein-releasing ABC transporter permease subunit [Moraxella nasovis]